MLGELSAVLNVVVEPELELRLHEAGNKLQRIAACKLFLRLPLKLRVNGLRGEHEARAAEDVFGKNLHALRLKSVHVHEGAHRLPETVLEARFMRASLRSRDQVHIAFARKRPFGRPDHHPRGAFARGEPLRRLVRIGGCLKGLDHRFAVDFREEILLEAAFVLPVRLSSRAFIAIIDFAARKKHGLGSEQPNKRSLGNFGRIKILRIGFDRNPGARLRLRTGTLTDGKGFGHKAVPEAHRRLFAVAPDGNNQVPRERIRHGNADAVQTARKGIGAGAVGFLEFSARMQTRKDEFNDGCMLFRMHADRNPSTVILHRDDAGLAHRNRNLRPEPCEHFVARVVDDFLDDVKGIVRQRVHARTLLNGFKPLKHPDGALAVIVFFLLLDGHCCVECAQNALRRKLAAG